MPRSLHAYLLDIQDAINEIEKFVDGREFSNYEQDSMVRAAVERKLLTIGEAMAQIEQHFPRTKQRIDDARNIVDFRNFLIHQYVEVDDELVWSVIKGPLVRLKLQIHEWMGDLKPDE
jgi:uncharacterized protein with HEPN domain